MSSVTPEMITIVQFMKGSTKHEASHKAAYINQLRIHRAFTPIKESFKDFVLQDFNYTSRALMVKLIVFYGHC